MSMRWLAAAVAAVSVWGAGVFAQEWDANAAVAADEASVDSIQSLRGKGTIQIGGGANVAVYARWTEGFGNNTAGNPYNTKREMRSTAFETDSAYLNFKVKASENSWLMIKLDLDDSWNHEAGLQHDDFLEEIYFTFDNIACTGLGVKFGKMEIPFGYDKDDLLIHPYLHAGFESNFNKLVNGNYGFLGAGMESPIAEYSDYPEFHSVEYDNYFAITPYWNGFDGKLLLEASLFQSKRDVNNDRRSNDDLAFRSGALRATWRPLEKLMIQGSLLARYNDASNSRNAATTGITNVSDYMYASSLAVDYTFSLFCRDMNVFAEWQHSWNSDWDYNERRGNGNFFTSGSSSDDIHAGLGYQITDKIKLNLQGEWLRMRSDGNTWGGGADYDSTLYRALFAVEYKLSAGMIAEVGAQKEWLKLDNASKNLGAGAQDSFDAMTVYGGIKYNF